MKASYILFLFLIFVVVSGCGDDQQEKKQMDETTNFVYISTSTPSMDQNDEDGIGILNQWLRNNPEKEVVSFSGVLDYREGVSGYVVYFVHGDNSGQNFKQVSTDAEDPENAYTFEIDSLQSWMNSNPDAKIVSISTIPAYSGGVREYVVCYKYVPRY